MKVGAGGLQAMIAQDAARGVEHPNTKTAADQVLLQSEDPALRRLINDLNKAVERMRRAAEAFNQPMDFEVKRKDRPKIKARDRRTGVSREFTLDEAEEWLEEMSQRKGRLNGYV